MIGRAYLASRPSWRRRRVCISPVFGALLVLVATLVGTTPARASGGPPLGPENFAAVAPEGFGDRNNSWAWSMQFWQGKLYVGTNHAFGCVSDLSLNAGNPQIPYPPNDTHLVCPTDPSTIDMAAQIWAWEPTTSIWTRVYVSPTDPANGGIPNPSYPGKYLPPDIGFRTAAQFNNPYEGNVSTLCFGGVSAQALGFGVVPPPRILCTTDGLTFTPIPQTGGTFLGSLPNASMRGMTFWNNQLWIVNGTFQGNGPIIVSVAGQDPLSGNNVWTYAVATGGTAPTYYDMAVFNGYLYAGQMDTANGYAIAKTTAQGNPPYTWTEVVTNGAYLSVPATYCISLTIFGGRLYAGAAGPGEQIRINADDTWDLVVGTPRINPSTGQWIYPLSGLSEGYDSDFNTIVYRMGVHNGQLFSGTYDLGIRDINNADQATLALMQPALGADVYRTVDGWYVTAITQNGFNDEWDYAIRNFVDTPFGLFVGTIDEYYGLDIYRGLESATPPPILAPQHANGETSHGQFVLSWDSVPNAVQYLVYAAPIQGISVSGAGTANFPGPFAQIATTSDTVYVDAPSTNPNGYLYQVVAVDAHGNQSDPSNEVQAPEVTPAMTYATALADITTLEQRRVFRSTAQGATAQQLLQEAQELAATGNLAAAKDTLDALNAQLQNGSLIDPTAYPDGTDLEIVVGKLDRRLKLAIETFIDATSL